VQALLDAQLVGDAAGSQINGPQPDPVGVDVHWHFAAWQALSVV
jgi:hypothetical protein